MIFQYIAFLFWGCFAVFEVVGAKTERGTSPSRLSPIESSFHWFRGHEHASAFVEKPVGTCAL